MDYGGKNFEFRPFAKDNPEPEGKMPNYGEPITIGVLNQVSDTLDYNEVSTYGGGGGGGVQQVAGKPGVMRGVE